MGAPIGTIAQLEDDYRGNRKFLSSFEGLPELGSNSRRAVVHDRDDHVGIETDHFGFSLRIFRGQPA